MEHARHSRVAIDVTDFVAFIMANGTLSGIQRFVYKLIEVLEKDPSFVAICYHRDEFVCFNRISGSVIEAILQYVMYRTEKRLYRNGKRIFWGARWRLFKQPWSDRFFSRFAFESGDIYFAPGAHWDNLHPINELMRQRKKKNISAVFFIHDLIPYYQESFVSFDAFENFSNYIELVRENATLVLCNSNYTKADYLRYAYNTPSEHVVVIPLAHEFETAAIFPKRQGSAVRPSIMKLSSEEFVLCVGTIERRKNQIMLLRSWRQLSNQMRVPKLILAGRYGSYSDDIRIFLSRETSLPIETVEAPNDEELATLFSNCRFTVFPSLAEGWGIPVGESLWMGKPCVASSATSIPEVGEAFCKYFNPTDLEDMTRVLEQELKFPGQVPPRSQLRSWSNVAIACKEVLSRLHTDI